MSHQIFLTYIILFFIISNISGQTDTLINYDIQSGQIRIYNTYMIDSSLIFDNTIWDMGDEPGFELLDLNPPDTTYNNSGFTDLIPVQKSYSVSNYPFRTAVKIFYIQNDTLKQKCSGILIAKNYVLTDCHCIGIYDSTRTLIFYDSLIIFPAFDNGSENLVFGKSESVEYITFKSNLNGYYKKDIALIKIKDDLGIETGWVGIAYIKDDVFFEENVFFKFSYPGTVDPSDSTRVFNGDTLYYNYGNLDLIDTEWLGYNISGIPGQSGSSLICTDNEGYYSTGTLVWGAYSRHLRITPEIFYAFEHAMNYDMADLKHRKNLIQSYYLSEAFPNPFNSTTKFKYILPDHSLVQIVVFDVMGREIMNLGNEFQAAGKHEVTFDGKNLASGVYIFQFQIGDYYIIKKAILVK